VNAIPSEPRAPRTGRSGGVSFRDVAITTGPLVLPGWNRGCGLRRGRSPGRTTGETRGKRHAKEACRTVLVARLIAQGRVGLWSRRIAYHRASHRLLSATSAPRKAGRQAPSSLAPGGAETRGMARALLARLEAQPLWPPTQDSSAYGAKRVPSRFDAPASAFGPSRGKGVLAA
jgi:hypothetical protein